MTNREKVLSVLRLASTPLDDDEVARRAAISPRQTVNQICNGLAREGLLTRVTGPDGKIVNAVRTGEDAHDGRERHDRQPMVSRLGSARDLPPGDSSEQRRAERAMLDALGGRLGVALNPRRIERPDGVRVELDGADADLTVLVECFAHQGTAKVAQKYKLVNDAVKLHWIGATLAAPPRRILCVTDAAAVQHLRGRSWQGHAIRELGVEIEVVELPESVRAAVMAAQVRQFR